MLLGISPERIGVGAPCVKRKLKENTHVDVCLCVCWLDMELSMDTFCSHRFPCKHELGPAGNLVGDL